VNVIAEDFTYRIYYPITFSNINRDGDYPIPISIYNKIDDKSSISQAIVTLDNTATNKTTQSATVLLKVRKGTPRPNGTTVNVKDGNIVVCTTSGCETLSEADYNRAREIVISSGNVRLSNLTYEQLKGEVLADIQQKNAQELQLYVNRIIKIDNDMQDSMYSVDQMIRANQAYVGNQTNQTQKLLRTNLYIAGGMGFAVIILVVGVFYVLWLKNNTTHLD